MMSTVNAGNEVLETREIYQFHFITWPDMGVPEVVPILALMKTMDEYYDAEVSRFVEVIICCI
jgi:protein tyrosine phosphatase